MEKRSAYLREFKLKTEIQPRILQENKKKSGMEKSEGDVHYRYSTETGMRRFQFRSAWVDWRGAAWRA